MNDRVRIVKAPPHGATLHTTPSDMSPSAGRLYAGDVARRLETRDGYVLVHTPNTRGWIKAKDVKLEAL